MKSNHLPAEKAAFQSVDVMLTPLRNLFNQAALALARTCSTQGSLDPALLDRWQVPAYELAFASAELLAAETLAASAAGDGTDAGLARLFIIDAIAAVIARLETVCLETGHDIGVLQALAALPAFTALRQAAGSTTALAQLGRAVVTAQGDIGQVELAQSVAMASGAFERFAAGVVAPMAGAIHREDLTVPEDIIEQMREMGAFGLSIPEAYGGSATGHDDDTMMMIAVTEALSEASLAAAGSLITRPEILARALLAGGTDDQKTHWLPKIAAGRPLCAISITEPDFGSDVASLMLAGTRTPGGWLLNGAKTWCTFAGKAELLMVVTRTNRDRSLGHKGLSLLLVEKPSYDGHDFSFRQEGGGALTGRAIPTIGYRGMHSFDLSFENFFVSDDHVIGGEAGLGKGFYYTMSGMTGGRMQTAARASGVMRAAIKAAVRYAQDRKVFGAALASLPLTQARIARMAARYAACRQLTYAIGRRLESGGNSMEASLAKLIACRSAETVTRDALQIHGGMGYAEETPVSRYFVDARVLSIFEGAEETLALKVIARSLLDNALEKAAQP